MVSGSWSWKQYFVMVIILSSSSLFPGEFKSYSSVLHIDNADRHKGGVYICMANNGIGQPASAQVTLKVLCELYNNFTKILCKFTLILYEKCINFVSFYLQHFRSTGNHS